MTPTVGRIVHFRLTAEQAEQVAYRRADEGRHAGNPVAAGSVVPMIITAVWPDEYAGNAHLSHHAPGTQYESTFGVNGQALLDGNDSLWVTSAPQHSTGFGCWFWPPKV